MKIRTVFDISKIDYSKENVVNLMVALEAPPLPEGFKRNSVSIMAALDRSGSMSGEKIESLRQTMYKLIDNMTDQDSLGLVWFGGDVQRVGPVPMDAGNKENMKNCIAGTSASGGTPMQAGLFEAFSAFGARKAKEGCMERVVLLTDGQATDGAKDIADFMEALRGTREGITMSCFGYGSDYNESLLEGLSKNYSGGNYFVDSIQMLPEAFARELGSLLSCFCHNTTVSVSPVDGCPVLAISVLNDLPSTIVGRGGRMWTDINAGDLFFGEKKKVFLRMKCPPRSEVADGPVDIVEVDVAYTDVETGVRTARGSAAGLSFVRPDEADTLPDEEVAEQVLVLDAAKTQIEAKDMAGKGEWQMAKQICDQMIENLEKYGTDYTRSFASVMRSSASAFSSGYSAGGSGAKCLSSTSYAVLRGGRGMSGGAASSEMKCFASSYCSSNSVTSSLVDSFTQGRTEPEPKKTDRKKRIRKTVG